MPGTETTRDEMHRLAAYLRQNPSALASSPEEIAAGCGIPAASVRAVVSTRSSERKEVRPQSAPRDWGGNVSRFLDKLFSRPMIFVIVTFLITVGISVLFEEPMTRRSENSMQITIQAAVQIVTVLGMICCQMLCFYWRARARIAIYGSLIVGGATTAMLVINLLLNTAMRDQRMFPILAVAGMTIATAMYAFIGVGFASLGGYVRFRKEEASLRKRSRQDLLERLFEIEEALRQPAQPDREWRIPLLAAIRRRLFLYAPLTGFGFGLGAALLTIILPGPPPDNPERVTAGFAIVQMFVGTLSMAFQVGFAYLGGSPWRGVLASLAYGYASTAAALLPIGTMGVGYVAAQGWTGLIIGTSTAIVFGVFAGLGAYVEDRAYRARRRQANDPTILLGEFVEIQRLLSPTAQSKCVIVVDAAKSSLMKANADALIAEWSFRAYQEFIEDIVNSCGGKIYATSGDGAIASFDVAEAAFLAARTIQTKISDFNAFVNRLNDPFRLRIGVHCGEVRGDLDEVEFTEVLDIAAHVEAASQIGGIAATAPVVEQLPEHRFAELQELIDGFKVYLALNPTLDPS